ncbi:hypothetical protein FF2_014374 [Malus domestica]
MPSSGSSSSPGSFAAKTATSSSSRTLPGVSSRPSRPRVRVPRRRMRVPRSSCPRLSPSTRKPPRGSTTRISDTPSSGSARFSLPLEVIASNPSSLKWIRRMAFTESRLWVAVGSNWSFMEAEMVESGDKPHDFLRWVLEMEVGKWSRGRRGR